jgi:hypothetical protein
MRNRLKALQVGLGVVLVLGALLVGTAAAQRPVPGAPGGMHGAVVAKAAAILGVPEAQLTEAFAQAHEQALDDAVKAGYLTRAQADGMKQRHRAMPQTGGPGAGMIGVGMMGAGMMGGRHGGPGYGPRWDATPTPTR